MFVVIFFKTVYNKTIKCFGVIFFLALEATTIPVVHCKTSFMHELPVVMCKINNVLWEQFKIKDDRKTIMF